MLYKEISELILLNIVKSGLQTRTTLLKQGGNFIGSTDLGDNQLSLIARESERNILCLHEVKEEHLQHYGMSTLEELFNHYSVGVFSIFTERSWRIDFKSRDELQREFSNRLRQGIYIILKPQTGGFRKAIRQSVPYGNVMFNELIFTTNINPDQILAILCPIDLINIVKQLFHDKKIYSIEQQTNIYFSTRTFEMSMQGYGTLVDPRTEIIQLSAPNYVSALKECIADNGLSSFTGHAVRLPTPLDLETVSKQMNNPLVGLFQQASELTTNKRAAAAINIQKIYRGFISRKKSLSLKCHL